MRFIRYCLSGLTLVVVFLLAGSAPADAQTTVLNVNAASLGFRTLDVPHSSTGVQNYLVIMVSVTDDHGMPVIGLKTGNFEMWGVSIGNAVPAQAISLSKCTVEGIVASDTGTYLLQIGSADFNVLNGASGNPAKAVIRVTRTTFSTLGGGAPNVVAAGQTVF